MAERTSVNSRYTPDTFEQHDLPGLRSLRNKRSRAILFQFVKNLQDMAKLPRGLVKEIARLALTDSSALEARPEPAQATKIGRGWTKIPDGTPRPTGNSVQVIDTPFGTFAAMIPATDSEMTPFSYDEAGEYVRSLREQLEPPKPIVEEAPVEPPQAPPPTPPVQPPEVRFAVETELDWRQLVAGVTARQRALEVFSMLRVWDTEASNGVLIYVLFADRDVEIVADRGFNGKVTTPAWQGICRSIRDRFAAGEFEGGILGGIEAVSRLMATHFPAPAGGSRNEMPDRPVLL